MFYFQNYFRLWSLELLITKKNSLNYGIIKVQVNIFVTIFTKILFSIP